MSLRVRLVAAFAYVLVLVLVALEVPLALSLARRVDAEVKAEAAGQAQVVAAGVAGKLGDREALDSIVRRAATALAGRVIVVDARGRLLSDSAGTGLRGTPYGDRPEIRAALDSNTSQGRRHSDTLGEDLLFTATPVRDEDRITGAVRVTQSVGAIDARVRRNVLALVGVGVAALALGLLLAWVLAGSLARPLKALARTARRVEGGDLDARAEVSGSSEQQEVAIAFNDMTERLAESLAAQRDFVGNASHQLRTPLTGLRLRLEAAALKAGNPALARELEAAEREAERLARLLTALLTLGREGERPALRAPTELGASVAQAVERWERRAWEAGRRLVALGDGASLARASDEDVAIALDNLVENALLYAPAETTVTLEWGTGAGCAYFAVADEGPGIAPGEEEAVFERFRRGSAAAGVPGTGLGLAIVRVLARRWGGSASIESRPEGGTRVEVRFPAETRRAAERPASTVPA
jgi:two-component system, OmpR family, sensor kinase